MINCENPTILLNPYYEYLLMEHKRIIFRNRRYLYDVDKNTFQDSQNLRIYSMSLIYPKTSNISEEEANQCYIINIYTGEMIPLYIVVPCSKCRICNARKVKDWECRAMCETAYSITVPLFITLTYNDDNLPSDGNLHKEHISAWLRKFRDAIRYRFNHDNIRFCCCGEYGKKHNRPHYHLILWNVPNFDTWDSLLNLIETTWCKGFIYVKPSNMGAISYIMKYIRKNTIPDISKDDKIPHDEFFFASRRNGLGFQYLCDNLQFFRKNLTTQFDITDPFTSQTRTYTLPRYFIAYIYPQLSKLIDKDIRDEYLRLFYHRNKIYTFTHGEFHEHTLFPFVLAKFAMLPQTFNATHLINEDVEYRKFCETNINGIYNKYKVEQLQQDFDFHIFHYNRIINKLVEYEFKCDIKFLLELKSLRKDKLNKLFEHSTVTSESISYKARLQTDRYLEYMRNQSDGQ